MLMTNPMTSNILLVLLTKQFKVGSEIELDELIQLLTTVCYTLSNICSESSNALRILEKFDMLPILKTQLSFYFLSDSLGIQ